MDRPAKVALTPYDDALARLAGAARAGPPEVIDSLRVAIAASADPPGAAAGLARIAGAAPGRLTALQLAALVPLAAGSRFLAVALAATPSLARWLALPGAVDGSRSPGQLSRDLGSRVARVPPGDVAGLHRALRRFKQREIARVALRDLGGRATLAETTREIADIAAAAFDAAVAFHFARLAALHGAPEGAAPGATGFVVIGMGKLGGRELNFSSDVDVLYAYQRDGMTSGGTSPAGGALGNFAFYARLAEHVTRALSLSTEDGFVFRVDLNLRPEGRSGPIASSAEALERYYEAQGRTWERAALLKARPIAGDVAVGEALLARLAPFVYRRSLDLGVVEELRQMKLRVERQAEARGHRSLKLGPGGIREVEFYAQALQLVAAGRDPSLRERATLPALDKLLFAGHVSARDHAALADAYVLLRRLEHRVQMVAERQTHDLPDEPDELGRLARRAGFADADAMLEELTRRRAEVRERFDGLLATATVYSGEAARATSSASPECLAVLDEDASDEDRASRLAALGWSDPEAALGELSRLAFRRDSPFGPAPRPEHADLGARLLAECAGAPDPDLALRGLSRFVAALSAPRAYFDVLARRPRAARLVVSVFGTSELLSQQLARQPELLELLAEGGAPPRRAPGELAALMRARVAAAPDDTESRLAALVRAHNEERLRLALHDIAGALDLEEVFEGLSELADACIAECLALTEAEIAARFGPPAGGATFAVVALGKLGGRELGYHSDLDLAFVYSGSADAVDGARITNGERFVRLGQRLLALLAVPLREGALYRVDARLRPSGSKGPLVVSERALADYHARGAAALWERQAWLKARAVAGDALLFSRLWNTTLAPSIFATVDPREAAREIAAMRERLEREGAPKTVNGDAEGADLKLGAGGLADVDFAAQLLQLVHGALRPSVRTPSTLAALRALRDAGLLSPDDSETLQASWRFLRRLELRLRLMRDRGVSKMPRSGRALAVLARRLGYAGADPGAQLLAEHAEVARRTRAVFRRLVG